MDDANSFKILGRSIIEAAKMREEYDREGGFSSSGPEEDDFIRYRTEVSSPLRRALLLTMQALYQREVSYAEAAFSLDESKRREEENAVREVILQDTLYLDKANAELCRLVAYLFDGVINNLAEIDKAIAEHITCNWDIDRLVSVDRAILRLGVFCLRQDALNKLKGDLAREEVCADGEAAAKGERSAGEAAAERAQLSDADAAKRVVQSCADLAGDYDDDRARSLVYGLLSETNKSFRSGSSAGSENGGGEQADGGKD
ncbi:hypothetical protein IJT93_08400 [bacterium]|nr:hypothetical protein [bacterium]